MREWFLSSEIMKLETMPSTTAGISIRAKKENWKSRKAKGGGRALEYHISNFEPGLQEYLRCIDDMSEVQFAKFINTSEINTKKVPGQQIYLHKASEQQEQLYRFLANFMMYPVEKIKMWDSEGVLIDKLNDRLKTIESYKKELDRLNNNWWFSSSEDSEPSDLTHTRLEYYDIEIEMSTGQNKLVLKDAKENLIVFNRGFLSENINVDPDEVFLMPALDDSMQPTLKNKSILMINRVEEFSGDGIYIFQFADQLMLKRLQFTKMGLNVLSDNTNYDAWEITRDEIRSENFKTIGKVVWSGQSV